MTTEQAAPAPTAPVAPPPAPPPPSAPPAPAAPPAAPERQKPAGDPRPRSQRIAAPPTEPVQTTAPVVEAPAVPPAPPAPPTPPPEPPEPVAKQKTEAEIAQELEDRRIAREADEAKATKLKESKDFFKDAKVKARDLLASDPEISDVRDFIDRLVDEGTEAGKLLAQDEVDYSGRDEVVQEHEAFKQEVINSYFEALPDAAHEAFIAKVNGKRAGDWVKALLESAPSIPAVKEAVYNDALATAQELVPAASRADFDAELGKTSKDLRGLLHAAYQAGFMTDAPRGSRPVAETGGGAMDIERWRKDRTFRQTLSREENNRYHQESLRQQREERGL